MSVAKIESAVIVVGGIAALFVGYKLWKGAGSIVSTVTETITGAYDAGRSAVVSAYDGAVTVITNRQYYSPSAMQGSMTKAGALKLADELARDDLPPELQPDMFYVPSGAFGPGS